MNVDASYLSLVNPNYYQNTSLKDKISSKNEATGRTYASDAAVVGTNKNGDILELSSHSLSYFGAAATSGDAVDAPTSGLDFFREVVQQLRDSGFYTEADALQNLMYVYEASVSLVEFAESQVSASEAVLSSLHYLLDARQNNMLLMEDYIGVQTAYLDNAASAIQRLEQGILVEQGRIDDSVLALTERLARQFDQIEASIERQEERFETRLTGRLARLARREARFNARMARLEGQRTAETERRAEVDRRLAELEYGSPEYEAARAVETARRDRFDARLDRLEARHQRRFDRVTERHERWYDRQNERIYNQRADLTDRRENKPTRLEEAGNPNVFVTILQSHLDRYVARHTRASEYINTLQSRLDERRAEYDLQAVNINEVEIPEAEGRLEDSNAALATSLNRLTSTRDEINNLLEGFRQQGILA